MRVLVVRGSEGALEEHGLEGMKKDFQLVINLPPGEDARVLDSFGQVYELEFLDLDPADCAVVECFERIKHEWEQTHPEESHLGHASAGLWLLYWFSADMEPMSTLIRENRSNDLRAATTRFIETVIHQQDPHLATV